MRSLYLLFISFALVTVNNLFTQTKELVLHVTADHPNWAYKTGEEVHFTIEVKNYDKEIILGKMKYQIGLERMLTE